MLEVWTDFSLAIFDALLGWLRAASPDATIVAAAVGSALLLALVRKWTTDQDLLARVAADRKRLRSLRRQAKRERDADGVARRRRLLGKIGILSLRAEGRPLLISILPIAALATWCFARLEYHSPSADEGVTLRAWTPVSWSGSVVHIVPQYGIEAKTWTAEVVSETQGETARGRAEWRLRGKPGVEGYRLRIRAEGETIERDVSFSPEPYAAVSVDHGDLGVVTELELAPVDAWGIAPAALSLPPWLVAYLVLVVPSFWLSRRYLRVH